MNSRTHSKTPLRIEELETRLTPATLAPIEAPGLEVILSRTALVHTVESPTAQPHDRPFHLEEVGAAVFNPDGTISGNASGHATHLGAFTLQDTSTLTPDGQVFRIDGTAVLEAANGDRLYASFTGSLDFATGQATITFEWTGGTGRFANATGTTIWQISVNPDLTYSGVADGVINY